MGEIELQAECYQREPTRFVAEITTFDARARRRRALAISSLLVAGAVLSVPVPGWHLVAVPGFLLGAVVLGRRRLREQRRLESTRGPCPACASPVELRPSQASDLPVTLPCPSCREFLKLRDLR